jgi:NADH:ubiquinone reductase (H+-translocating)
VVDVSHVPGMPEHGYLMKTVGDAIRLRVDLIQRLEEASLSLEPAVRRRLLTFVVVGGGYSGVETRRPDFRSAAGRPPVLPAGAPGPNETPWDRHSGPHLLPQIGEKLGCYCGEHLQKRGIEVRLNSRVAALTAERAILDTGEVVDPPMASRIYKKRVFHRLVIDNLAWPTFRADKSNGRAPRILCDAQTVGIDCRYCRRSSRHHA